MKIALIGNMNNANFSIMRYLHDLGYDAKLFLYENDFDNGNEHFHWRNDTWEIEKWMKFIFKTSIRNSYAQILSGNFFWYLILSLLQKTAILFGSKGDFFNPGIKNVGEYIDANFQKYDVIIGSGNLPALFTYSKRLKLSIFYPYSTGVEYINVVFEAEKNNNFKNLFVRKLIKRSREVQINGVINKTNLIYNAEMGITNRTLLSLNYNVKNNFIPAVYVESNPTLKNNQLKELIERINSFDFSILMHSRHKWDDTSKHNLQWEENENKNNHWLIKAYSRFLKLYPKSNAKLIMMNYGEHTEKSKNLIKTLKLNKNIIWLEKMPRKELLEIIKKVDLVAGEFYTANKMIWGSTGWEAFACGKPFLNSFKFQHKSFSQIFGIPEPIILKSNSIDEIYESIIFAYLNPKKIIKIGIENYKWFQKHIGLNQTKEWIDYYLTKN